MVGAAPVALNGDVPENLPVISRPRDGAMLGGVCAGLARRWQLDPNLLRIALVVLSVFGGLGLVAYGSGLLLMPRDGQSEMPVRRILPFTRNWSTGAVVAATIATAVVVLAIGGFNGIGLGPVVVIFLVWFFGFRGRGSRIPAPPPEPTPFERAAENWRVRLVEQQTPGYESTALAAPETQRWEQPYTDPASDLAVRDDDLPAPVPVRRTRRSWRLWWLALVLVGSAVLAVTLLGLAGFPATPLAYASAVLAGLGLTLLASTRPGRPPLLLPATIVAAVATANLLVASHGLQPPSVGEQVHRFASGAQMPRQLDLTAGDLTVDLTGLALAGDQSLDVHVGAGQLTLQVPSDVTVVVDWTVKAGEAHTTDGTRTESRDGLDLSGATTYAAADPDAPVLHVRASVDLGELDVTR